MGGSGLLPLVAPLAALCAAAALLATALVVLRAEPDGWAVAVPVGARLGDGLDLRGKRVLVVDDVLATGGTLTAAVGLLEDCGAVVAGLSVVLEIPGLGGRDRLAGTPLTCLTVA